MFFILFIYVAFFCYFFRKSVLFFIQKNTKIWKKYEMMMHKNRIMTETYWTTTMKNWSIARLRKIYGFFNVWHHINANEIFEMLKKLNEWKNNPWLFSKRVVYFSAIVVSYILRCDWFFSCAWWYKNAIANAQCAMEH